jgi:hypothetical protein
LKVKHTIESIRLEYKLSKGVNLSKDVAKVILEGRLRHDGVPEKEIQKILQKGE